MKFSIWPQEVKFDLGGQNLSQSKVAYLTKGFNGKEIVLISIIISELWAFEMFNFASEVKVHFGQKLHIRLKDLMEKKLS